MQIQNPEHLFTLVSEQEYDTFYSALTQLPLPVARAVLSAIKAVNMDIFTAFTENVPKTLFKNILKSYKEDAKGLIIVPQHEQDFEAKLIAIAEDILN